MAAGLLTNSAQVKFIDAIHEVVTRVPGAYPHPYVLASAAALCGQPFGIKELTRVYTSVAQQPPYPWSLELMRDASERKYS